MVTEFKKKFYLAAALCFVSFLIKKSYSKRMYFNLEHPKVNFFDKEFYSIVTFKSRRVSRSDPVHYVTVNYTSKRVMDNNFTMSIYFYQLLSNMYKRSFVETHIKFCDLMERDSLIGDEFREAYYRVPEKDRKMVVLKCPAPPGFYSFPNMMFRGTAVLNTFPFNEGRVFINVTHRGKPTGRVQIDFKIERSTVEN